MFLFLVLLNGYFVTITALTIACRPFSLFLKSICFPQHTVLLLAWLYRPSSLLFFLFYSIYRHLSASWCAASALAREFFHDSPARPYFAYAHSHLIFTNVMLSMHFIAALFGPLSHWVTPPTIRVTAFSPWRVLSGIPILLLYGFLHIPQFFYLPFLQIAPGSILRPLCVSAIYTVFSRVLATITYPVLSVSIGLPCFLYQALSLHCRPSTSLATLSTYVLSSTSLSSPSSL